MEFSEDYKLSQKPKLPIHMHMRAQRNSMTHITCDTLRSNNYSATEMNYGREMTKGSYTSFGKQDSNSVIS